MTDAPARDWTALPTSLERVQRMAADLRQTYWKNAVAMVRQWIADAPGETHAGIGIPWSDVLEELVRVEQVPGYTLPRVEKSGSWSATEIEGAA